MHTDEDLANILRKAQRIAVVGWSPDPSRPSHSVSDYLHDQGYDIFPVNPNCEGQRSYGKEVVCDLGELSGIDLVDVFRRSEFVEQHVDDALALGAPVFWMQLGVRNEKAAQRLEAEGITVVQDRCTAADHRRLGLGR